MMKKTTGIIAALLAAVILTGCGEKETSSLPSEIIVEGGDTTSADTAVFPLELADGTVINAAPERVASLSPAATEIIAELGYSDRLCAVSRYCDYPEGLNKQTAGSSENPDIDRLIELAPDVLFTVSPLAEREVYALEAAGITVADIAAPTSLKQYGAMYGTITAVFEGEEAGKAAAEKAENALRSAASGIELGTFIYVTPKLSAAGADTLESAALSLCGINLFTGEGYSVPDEELPELPQYIIAADSLTESDISKNAVYSAMLSGGAKLLFVPAERFERPSARLSDVFSAIREQMTETAE